MPTAPTISPPRTSPPAPQRVEDLPPRIAALVRRLESLSDLDPQKARELLAESGIEAEDLIAWADFDHPATDSYGRKLVWDGGHFELMVMSWRDGDYSAIHDHGYAQWGAVKLFGNAEHAAFSLDGETLTTRGRSVLAAGSVIAVDHDLIHQMGNVGEPPYVSLHLYGCYERDGEVTADARIFDLEEGTIQFTGGGVFFHLPEERIDRRERRLDADLPTRLRHDVELVGRLRTMEEAEEATQEDRERCRRVEEGLFSATTWAGLRDAVASHVEAAGSVTATPSWALLTRELRAAARLQSRLRAIDEGRDLAQQQAELWDEVLGPRRLRAWTEALLPFLGERFGLAAAPGGVLSLGCRTGQLEEHLVRQRGVSAESLLGVDENEAMAARAASKVPARAGDPLRLVRQGVPPVPLVLAANSALLRLEASPLEDLLRAAAGLTLPGGLFVAEMLAPRPGSTALEAAAELGGEELFLEQSRLRGTGSEAARRLRDSLHAAVAGNRVLLRAEREKAPASATPEAVRDLAAHLFGGEVVLCDAETLSAIENPAAASAVRYLLVARRSS